jgi:hypothetical protein
MFRPFLVAIIRLYFLKFKSYVQIMPTILCMMMRSRPPPPHTQDHNTTGYKTDPEDS